MLPVRPRTKATRTHSAIHPPAPMHLKPTADNTIVLKSPREIALMRDAGKIVAATIRALEDKARPGVTTHDLDHVAATIFKEAGAESTALGYFGYPGHIC